MAKYFLEIKVNKLFNTKDFSPWKTIHLYVQTTVYTVFKTTTSNVIKCLSFTFIHDSSSRF